MTQRPFIFELSETALARMLVVDRRLHRTIDPAGGALNREALSTDDLLNVVLDAPGVPAGKCRPPLWDTYFTIVEPTLGSCLTHLRVVSGFVHAAEPWGLNTEGHA